MRFCAFFWVKYAKVLRNMVFFGRLVLIFIVFSVLVALFYRISQVLI